MKRALLSLAVVWSASAYAQTPPDPGTAAPPDTNAPQDEVLTPTQGQRPKPNAATCARLDLTPGALLQNQGVAPNVLATPIPWSEFEVVGSLIDSPQDVRAMLEPTMQQLRTSLSRATMPHVAQLTTRFGYQLIGHKSQDMPSGTKLVLYVAPLPMVKRVSVNVDESWREKLLEDEVRRRMGLRNGTYLPWEPVRRECTLLDEKRRIEEFLFDEGYFEADVKVVLEDSSLEAEIDVDVTLGDKYKLGKITVACPAGFERQNGACIDPATKVRSSLELTDAEIDETFRHRPNCLIQALELICIGKQGFSRAQYQADIQKLRERFQRLGFPAVRIVTTDPRASVNRDKETVNPVLTIDQRRRVQVDFQGYDRDAIGEADLQKQLTFNEAGSADDVEAAESARAIATFLQTRGFFDARVTWERKRRDVEGKPGTNDPGLHLDTIVFSIDMTDVRRVASVQFVGNRAIPTKTLEGIVATKVAGFGLFTRTAAITSSELINDQDRIKEAYRREGYPNARVWPSASTARVGLGDAAATASLLALDAKDELHVRFTIEEGAPTLVSRVVAQGEGTAKLDDELCKEVLGELASALDTPAIATRTDNVNCSSTISGLPLRTETLATSRDRLRDFLYREGRARANIELATNPIGPNRVEARFTVKSAAKLKIGKVIVRGNFRTKEEIIRGELRLEEGELLKSDALAEGARRLRNTGLFDAVNIDLPDLDCGRDRQCNSEVINAVVRVEERHLDRAEIGIEGGVSQENGPFVRNTWALRNMFGRGIVFTLSGTLGTRIREAESAFRLPQWLVRGYVPRQVEFTTELSGLYRRQDTERFGELTTIGTGVGISRAWARPRTETKTAQSLGLSLEYAFRLRSRNVDALRPIGSDMDESQVAISTRTGYVALRFVWEHRIDRRGQLSPLAPEGGTYFEASAAFADKNLLGQDRFVKISGSVSKFFLIGSLFDRNLVLRTDLRYDQGFPFGAALLPEVERFFAGGDSTVRGYSEDRLETEVIQVGVPPLDNVSQIRVIPAGGNIRVLGTVDAQMRIWKILAGALFFDAGLITNNWRSVELSRTDNGFYDITDIRPSVGMGLRALTPFGIGALEYAVPLRPQLGDDPRGRIHFYFAARAQF